MFQYIKAGRCFGPVSAPDLLELVEKQVVGSEDLVRLDGVTSWRPARQVVEDLHAGRFTDAELDTARRRSAAPAGGHTVMTSAPPLPPNPLPRVGGRRCTQCATEMRADARFCKQCGARLPPPLCNDCGRQNDADAIFCDGCGHELGSH
jgi:hypothetical protein